MTRATRELLAQVLELPLDERAKFAAELLDSLHDAEADVEAAWAAEIQERVSAARAGELESTEWREVLDRIERDVVFVEVPDELKSSRSRATAAAPRTSLRRLRRS